MAALLAGEPLVLAAVGNHTLPLPAPLNLNWSFTWTVVYVGEATLGVLLLGWRMLGSSPSA
ncbi:MAG TPA: hypothetical protein VFM09_08905 [Marmoricola sp.]|nr:hypothetical protein [Marmoricola sp.]